MSPSLGGPGIQSPFIERERELVPFGSQLSSRHALAYGKNALVDLCSIPSRLSKSNSGKERGQAALWPKVSRASQTPRDDPVGVEFPNQIFHNGPNSSSQNRGKGQDGVGGGGGLLTMEYPLQKRNEKAALEQLCHHCCNGFIRDYLNLHNEKMFSTNLPRKY